MSMTIGIVMMKASGSPVGTLNLLQRMLPSPHATLMKLSQTMQGRKEALGGGSSDPTMVVNIEPDIVIMSETIAEPSTLIPKSSVDVAGP